MKKFRKLTTRLLTFALAAVMSLSAVGGNAVYRLILDQAVDALKNLANSDKPADLLFRGDYSDEE